MHETYSKVSRISQHTDEWIKYFQFLSTEKHTCCMYHECSQCATLTWLVWCYGQQQKGTTLLVSYQ